ncbi:MAG TPA: phosphate-binding protein [Arcobacter sp.]|jgi:phosphate transport system substrate-binding protein|nr:phosphate-binding protein [Arcobacter sp.]
MKLNKFKKLALASVILLAISAQAREQLRIVGSSTVYPFASMVAEEFGAVTKYPSPIVESTGTGGGMKIFCSGASDDTPDITNASRRMNLKEFYLCDRNGVSDITEITFGYDGIAIGQNGNNKPFNLSKRELMLAVIKMVPNKAGTALIENPYKKWSDINPSLPDHEIIVYGPPKSSGTRDAFEEIVLEYQTQEMKVYRDAGLKGYRVVRTDGVYVPSGENDNLIVQKLTKNPNAVGIFGYSFLIENSDRISDVTIDGITPTPETISSKSYPISRSLFFYVKNAHKDIESQQAYIDMFTAFEMIGEDGILSEIGLIPLNDVLVEIAQEKAANRIKLTEDELKKNSH